MWSIEVGLDEIVISRLGPQGTKRREQRRGLGQFLYVDCSTGQRYWKLWITKYRRDVITFGRQGIGEETWEIEEPTYVRVARLILKLT